MPSSIVENSRTGNKGIRNYLYTTVSNSPSTPAFSPTFPTLSLYLTAAITMSGVLCVTPFIFNVVTNISHYTVNCSHVYITISVLLIVTGEMTTKKKFYCFCFLFCLRNGFLTLLLMLFYLKEV